MQRSRCFASRWFFAISALLFSLPSTAQAPAPPTQAQHQQERFVKQEVLRRTPLGVPESERGLDSGIYQDLIADGYIFVSQNIRGRFKSEGVFIIERPPRDKSKPNSIDEGTDAYDAIDWIIKNVPNHNGRVGIWGISGSGWLVTRHRAHRTSGDRLQSEPSLPSPCHEYSPG